MIKLICHSIFTYCGDYLFFVDSGDKEGSFDGWCLLQTLKKKAEHIGVTYIKGTCDTIDVTSKVNGITVS